MLGLTCTFPAVNGNAITALSLHYRGAAKQNKLLVEVTLVSRHQRYICNYSCGSVHNLSAVTSADEYSLTY
jgi:hypothetical protein